MGDSEAAKFILDSYFSSNYALIKPFGVAYDVTDNCNLKCVTCAKWQGSPNRKELTFEEFKKAVLNLKSWLGDFELFFSGGEPLLKKEIFSMIEFCAKNRIKAFLVTNGQLIDEKTAKKLVSSRPDGIGISLNSTEPKIHDFSRGVKGSFEKVLKGIDFLKKAGFQNINIQTILFKQNLGEVPDLIKWVKKNRLAGISFQVIESQEFFRPFYRKAELEKIGKPANSLVPESPALAKTIDRIINLKKEGFPVKNSLNHLKLIKKCTRDPSITPKTACFAGLNFAVDPYGEVRLCFAMDPIGSVLKSKPEKIFNSPAALKQRAKIKKCDLSCRLALCNYLELNPKFSYLQNSRL